MPPAASKTPRGARARLLRRLAAWLEEGGGVLRELAELEDGAPDGEVVRLGVAVDDGPPESDPPTEVDRAALRRAMEEGGWRFL